MNLLKYITKTASCPTFGDWAIANKRTVKWGSQKRGDIVLFDFNHNGTSDHIGIVTKVGRGCIETIEGNTGNGSDTNGDGVYRRTRYKNNVNYFVRPNMPSEYFELIIATAEAQVGYREGKNNNNKYGAWFGANYQPWCCQFVCWVYAHCNGKEAPIVPPTGTYTGTVPNTLLKNGSKGEAVKQLQSFLNWYYAFNLVVDGEFGAMTEEAVRRFQTTEGITSDGEFGSQSYVKASLYRYTNTVTINPPTVTKPKKCVDTSYWQGKITLTNWKKVKANYDYAIHRASYTSQNTFQLNKDSTFDNNMKYAHEAGIKCGAYHYSQATSVAEAKKEAEFLCDILKNYTVDFYVVCDYEFGNRLNSEIGSKASSIANAFCDVVKSYGYKPMIYGNLTMMNNYLKSPNYPVWLAQYNSKCTYKKPYAMWQYTSSGSVNGISGRVDCSYVYEEPVIVEPPKEPEKTGYTGTFPSLTLDKSSTQAISDALKWGKEIAEDNRFHYGEYGSAKYKGTRIHDITHSSGCHFCNTNHAKKVVKATKAGYKGENWERTYVCNTFVTAMFAHGAMESTCRTKCKKGSCVGMNSKGRSPSLDSSNNWKYMGKLTIEDLKAGDVLVSESHMQCVYAPISSTKCKIIEAISYLGSYGSTASNNSIKIKEKKPSYTSVYRFVGTVKGTFCIEIGEISDRVKLLQKFLNWYGDYKLVEDGIFFEATKTAVCIYQNKEGLAVDGQFGTASLTKAVSISK